MIDKKTTKTLESIKRWYGSLYFPKGDDKEWFEQAVEETVGRCKAGDPNVEISKLLGAIYERHENNGGNTKA